MVAAAVRDATAGAVDAAVEAPEAADVGPADREAADAEQVDSAVPAAAAAAVGVERAAVVAERAVVDAVPVRAATEVHADALSQACEASQAAPWTPRRHLAWPGEGAVRRVWAQGARGWLAHQPSDRGRASCDDAQDQAWRQGVDQRVPRQ